MKVVIDSNVLISALIKDSTTRKLIVESDLEFYYPEISLHEIRKHRNLVIEKSGIGEQEYAKMLNVLLSRITLVPEEHIQQKLEEAANILNKIDPDDVVFLATALSMPDSVIWSNDKDFERQDKVKVLKTKEMVKF